MVVDEKQNQALAIIERLRTAGFTAYLAGGCVRDQILGVTPKDYDIATDALPAEVQKLFDHTVAVGARFGVIMVILGDHHFEVAT
ncbi:MAG TPA: polynucleotide adenylyltransferase PcnB, partial [Pirellulales bacterium]